MWNYLLITVVNYFILNAFLAVYLTIDEKMRYSEVDWKGLSQGFLILFFVGVPFLVITGIKSDS